MSYRAVVVEAITEEAFALFVKLTFQIEFLDQFTSAYSSRNIQLPRTVFFDKTVAIHSTNARRNNY